MSTQPRKAGVEDPTSRPPSVAPPAPSSGASPSVPPSSGALPLPFARVAPPIARRPERRLAGDPREPAATLAALRARVREALVRGDADAEARSAARLARHLFALDCRLDEAVACGRRAVAIRPDDEALRRLVADALRGLGEPGLAAAILRPAVDAACARAARDAAAVGEAVSGLLAIGDLLLRGGDVDGAIESFRYVAVVAPDRGDGQERLAIARGVAPSVIAVDAASRAYIGAAKKHQLAGDDARALEALSRAFEIDPAGPLPATVLADALDELGRADAADAVRAEHAHALCPRIDAARVVHATRRERARLRGDRAAVVATVLDELVELAIHVPPSGRGASRAALESILDELPDVGRAFRRVHACLAIGAESAAAWRALGHASSGAARVEAFAEAVSRDPSDEPTLAALREHARSAHDPVAIVDALVRALRHAPTTTDSGLFGARAAELAGWADEQLDDAALSAWAWERLLERLGDDRRARDELARLAGRRSSDDARLAEAERDASSADPQVRADGQRRLARLLFGRPDREAQHVATIGALLEAAADDPGAHAALDRLVVRLGGELLREALELRERTALDASRRALARAARIEAALRHGHVNEALSLAHDGAVAAYDVALALHVGDGAGLGAALARLAPGLRERSTVLAAAARACRLAGRLEGARAFAEAALRESPRDPRPAIQIAELAADGAAQVPESIAVPALERALGSVGARGRWALALAAEAEKAKELPLAAAWTRRAWALRPGDVAVARAWLSRAVALGDAEIVAEVVRTTTSLVATLVPLATELAAATRAIAQADAKLGEAVARELLGLGAARIAPIRDALVASSPPHLLTAVHERWLASGAPAHERPRVLLAIAAVARAAGDASRAADAAARVLDEHEADAADRARAQAILSELASAQVDADAEVVIRRALAERAGKDAEAVLDRAPRARLSVDDDARVTACADLLREAGRDLWDLAGDRDGALRSWLSGARLLGAEGLDRLEADIAAFGGDDAVREALFELVHRDDVLSSTGASRADGAVSLARAARLASFRLRAWERLVEQPPAWVEPLSVAREAAARATDPAALLPALERLAQRHGRPEILHDLYELAAGRAAGRYGARGVHYRAARLLERLGRPDEALGHAVRAFAAVPSEGAMLMMLERLARGSRRSDLAISALVEAADSTDDPDRKATWLDRASTIAEASSAAPEEHVELLLRLFVTAPSARTTEALVSAIGAAIDAVPTLRETWVHRLVRAHRRVEAQIGAGQRVAVLATVAQAIAKLDSVDSALELLARGAASTPRSDLDPLRPVAEEIAARDPEAARGWLERERGGSVLRAHVAWGSGDPDQAIALLADHAPPADDVDLGFGAGEDPSRVEIEILERWVPAARDKRAIAAAWERFGRRHGPAAELEAAKALDEAGQIHEAARALVDAWRSREAASTEVAARILELARQVLPQAGADADLVAMLVDDLQEHEGGEVPERIARWREIAEIRARRLGDRHAALEALVEAGRLAPSDDELWHEISELAESIGAHDRLAAALSQRLQRARPDKRVVLLRKLARVLEHDLGRDAEAAERWAELVRLLPADAEAADALERIAERRGDPTELLDLLRARAARLAVGHPERTRALRRIARELGGVQGRRGEVLAALREVHQQSAGDVEVALQLSGLARSAGDLGTAAEALLRSFRASTREDARAHLAIEGAKVLLELHDHDTASRLLHEAASSTALERDPRGLELARLQLEVAIARSDARDEAQARVRIADLDAHAPEARRAAHYASAARAQASLGEPHAARALAWRAARLAPGDAATAALLVELEFTVRPDAPRRAIGVEDAELLGLLLSIDHRAHASAEHLSMIAFARAELLDAARGPGAGYQDLNAWPDEVRARPLVQLALAERLAAEWSFGQAAAAFERAFAGDLHGLRALGPAALAAADAAARSNDSTRARAFLDLAARDPSCRIDARRRAVELARAVGDDDGALRALERLAAEATGDVRARALVDQARLLEARDPEAAAEAMRLAVLAVEPESPLREELEREKDAFERVRASRSLPPAPPPSLRDSGITSNRTNASFERAVATMAGEPPAPPPAPPPAWIAPQSDSEPPPRAARRQSEPPPASVAPPPPAVPAPLPGTRPPPDDEPTLRDAPALDAKAAATPASTAHAVGAPQPASTSGALDLESLGRIALDPSAPVAERVRALQTLGEAAHEAGREEEATRHFVSALELGDVASGDQAAELLALMPGRAADLLLVRRRQVFLSPGDRGLLDALHEAALAVRDHVFARAIDHVRRAFDPVAGPVPAPPLDAQLDRPDLVLPLLERRANPIAAEVLRLTWENAQLLFRKEPSVLGRGLERVTSLVPIGKVVAAAGRLLGTSRTHVHLRHRSGRDVEVVLLSPPVVLLGGDCREDLPDVRYVLGAGLVASHPAHCLLLAQHESAARSVWQALLSAFGPPEHGRGVSPDAGRLAAALWQSIPRAPQRRLGELLGTSPPTFEAVLDGARQVARRGGLYLSGDIAAAVRATLSEVGEASALAGPSPDLAAICAAHPNVADLFRLATSPEFAEARWRVPAVPGKRSPSGGIPAQH